MNSKNPSHKMKNCLRIKWAVKLTSESSGNVLQQTFALQRENESTQYSFSKVEVMLILGITQFIEF